MLVLSVSFIIVLLDQISKYMIRIYFVPGVLHSIIPDFFNLSYVRNSGAAWGIFSGMNQWLILFSFIMLLIIIVFRRSFICDALIYKLAMGLMIGGIVGNLIDRIRLEYVVDFLDFYLGIHHFPSFNLADSAICSGVGLYILGQFLQMHYESLKNSDVT